MATTKLPANDTLFLTEDSIQGLPNLVKTAFESHAAISTANGSRAALVWQTQLADSLIQSDSWVSMGHPGGKSLTYSLGYNHHILDF
jgi:hypothetical protein